MISYWLRITVNSRMGGGHADSFGTSQLAEQGHGPGRTRPAPPPRWPNKAGAPTPFADGPCRNKL